ncbi:hypothetical protein Tco_0615264, partial [Tanacetum coccineum]
MEILPVLISNSTTQFIPTESDSLPHAHIQDLMTYIWHQDSRIKKAKIHAKIKTSVNSNIQDLPYRYQEFQDKDYKGRLLASFQDDAKYEHVGQETRSQDGEVDKDKQGERFKDLRLKTKSKDDDKGSILIRTCKSGVQSTSQSEFLLWMHTRASNSELLEPLHEPERTLNQIFHRRNRRIPFKQRNEPPAQPRVVNASIVDINYFRHFLDILENYNPMDDEPIWAADRVVALTPGSTITIPKTANKFAIK